MPEAGAQNEAGSFGIEFHPGNTSIMAQAVSGILTQALYEAYVKDGLLPERQRQQYNFLYGENASVPPAFSVGIQMHGVGNQTGDFILTNRRVVLALALMGFSLAHEEDLMNLKEYSFDIVVDVGDRPQVIIAQGSLMNSPVLSTTTHR